MIPLVWVPGHMCGAWLYAPQAGLWPGSETTADTTRDDDLGAMARRLLAAAPERFAIAGLSMGGMVAMEVMARAPARVAGALLMDTNPTAPRARELEARRRALAGLEAEGPAGYVGAFVARFYAHDAAAAARLGAETEARMLEMPPATIAAQARAIGARRAMVPLLAGLAMPVEVLVGAEDIVCPPKLHVPLAQALPGATLTQVPGTGHIATLEAPEAVNVRLARLAERVV